MENHLMSKDNSPTYFGTDTLKRTIVPVTALILTIVALILTFISLWWLLILLVTLPVLAFGIYDWTQKSFTLTRNYPVAARIRWLFYDLRPYLRAYIVEGDLEGKPFNLEARALVHNRAKGLTDSHPFGTERDVSTNDYEWLIHSIAPAENPDKSPRVLIGNEQCSNPYEASVLNISAMSFGALSANAIEALNMGAKLGGFYHDTGEGGISDYHLKHGGDLVWEIGSGYFGCRDKNGNFNPNLFAQNAQLDVVKMTEIKLSQGAKPGHGGLLPGAKVTEEIAKIRMVEAGKDVLSPHGHSAFSTPVEMLEFAAKMRDLSGGKPVGIKLCVGQIYEVMAIMKAMLKTGIHLDFIVVDGGEGGTGAAPLELSNFVGMPLTEGLITVRNALVGSGLSRNLAIGADWCNAARAFMFSIGCIQAQRCHLGTCPTGVATQNKSRQRGLVVEVQAERAARFHRKTLEALAEIVAAAGLVHPRDLQPHYLMQHAGAAGAKEIDRIYDFLPKNVLLDAPEDTIYAEWWKAANPDSFKPSIDLVTERAEVAIQKH